MAYATVQNMIDRFGESELIDISDRSDAGEVDADVVGAALADASEIVDGYAGPRYRLPLDPAPALIVRLVCNLARYYLHKDVPPDVVKANYGTAMTELRDIAAGRLRLAAAGVDAPAAPSAGIVLDGDDRVFSGASLKGL